MNIPPGVPAPPRDNQLGRIRQLLEDNTDHARRFAYEEFFDAASREKLLLCCSHGANIQAVMTAEFAADGTCWIHGPVINSQACHPQSIRNLVAAVLRIADERDAWLSQSLLNSSSCETAAALRDCGFQTIADIELMMRPIDRMAAASGNAPLETRNYNLRRRDTFCEVLQATWQDSYDCVPLLHARSPQEALESHRHHTDGDPAAGLWQLILVDGQPAGVLLMSHLPDEQASADESTQVLSACGVEIVYMGLAPAFRGRGLSRGLLTCAATTAARFDASFLQLAVDVSNVPALAAYRRAGFLPQQRIACLGRLHPQRATRAANSQP